MKKKILILSLAYFPKHVGGAEVAIKEITDRIPSDDYEFHLVCNRFDSSLARTEKIGNVLVHRIGLSKKNTDMVDLSYPLFYLVKILYIPGAVLKILSLNRRYKFDAFWCMMLYMSYPVALLRALGFKRPYVLTLQEGDTAEHVFDRWYIKIFEPILLFGIRQATIVQTISNFLKTWVKDKGFLGNVVLLPNAVNTKHFRQEYSTEELLVVRKEFGLEEDDILLVTTSRLVHKNAVDEVVRAMALLPEKVKFVVFGEGPEEKALRDLAKELKVDNRILFRGQIGHEVMPKYLKACDIFVRPSRSEGMGNSFVEAMAARLPVIATQVGGIADFLFDEKRNVDRSTTGFAVDVDSPEQIKTAVEYIINNPQKVSLVLAEAEAMVVEKYDWDLIAGRMEEDVFQPLFTKEISSSS